MASRSAATAALGPLRIGMVGGGTVGGGVYEIIMNRLGGSNDNHSNNDNNSNHDNTNNSNHERNQQQQLVSNSPGGRRQCVITKVCVRDVHKKRSFHIDPSLTSFVTDVDSILNDTTIDLVVEVMGGTDVAKTVVMKALKNGKSVVTANKALIAEHLDDIQQAVVAKNHHQHQQHQHQPPYFGFEAAVCGGIPIIQTLQTCYTGDIITKVMGICNGTTNYMLGKMELGENYEAVLQEAQALGFAEADPTADVEGHDVRAKIAIMAKLAFGKTIRSIPTTIPCKGITQISVVDFEYAKLLKCTIKLVGTAARLSQYAEHDGPLSVYVAPKLVPLSHPLAAAKGPGNVIMIESANSKESGGCTYTGPGAGRFPTANSIVADVLRIAAGQCPKDPFSVVPPDRYEHLTTDHDYSSSFYIRIPFQDSLGIIRIMGELAETHGVSIHSILQNPIEDREAADFVVTTEECKLSQVEALCEDIDQQEFARAHALYMPLLMEL